MIVIIDYGLSNLASVRNMFRKIGAKDAVVSGDVKTVQQATKLLLPGVGAFDRGMRNLHSSGLVEVLNEKVLVEKIPVLGICLGFQMLTRRSEEGSFEGLGWLEADTLKFRPKESLQLKVPHMGWDYITVKRENPLLGMGERSRFYFAHSYYVKCDHQQDVLATCEFDGAFTCMVGHGNIFGAQFHPEKSLHFGMQLLRNFVNL